MRKQSEITDWRHFGPKAYLSTYYDARIGITSDEKFILDLLVEELKRGQEYGEVIEFGSGPTIHHSISISKISKRIWLTDYLKSNLNAIDDWLCGEAHSHNWDHYLKYAILSENKNEFEIEKKVKIRKELLKKIITTRRSNITEERPLDNMIKFDFLLSFYCADSITNSIRLYFKYIHNIFSVLKPGSRFMIAALAGAKSYESGPYTFPSVNLKIDDFRNALLFAGANNNALEIYTVNVKELSEDGFNKVFVARGNKHV